MPFAAGASGNGGCCSRTARASFVESLASGPTFHSIASCTTERSPGTGLVGYLNSVLTSPPDPTTEKIVEVGDARASRSTANVNLRLASPSAISPRACLGSHPWAAPTMAAPACISCTEKSSPSSLAPPLWPACGAGADASAIPAPTQTTVRRSCIFSFWMRMSTEKSKIHRGTVDLTIV
eukprot:scaffold20945_cov33-Tisochrysis_lutea.AAC.4